MPSFKATTAFVFGACVAPSIAKRHGRNFLSLGTELQPQVVASTLVRVEDEWRTTVRETLEAGDAEAPQHFTDSCTTVVNAVTQASSGDRGVVQEYLNEVCGQESLQGWRNKICKSFSESLTNAMTADVYENREDLKVGNVCQEFWQDLSDSERDAVEENKKMVKAAAEAARKAAEKAAQEKAAKEKAAIKAKKEKEERAEKEAEKIEKEAEQSQQEVDSSLAEAKEAIAEEKTKEAQEAKKAKPVQLVGGRSPPPVVLPPPGAKVVSPGNWDQVGSNSTVVEAAAETASNATEKVAEKVAEKVVRTNETAQVSKDDNTAPVANVSKTSQNLRRAS